VYPFNIIYTEYLYSINNKKTVPTSPVKLHLRLKAKGTKESWYVQNTSTDNRN